MRAIAQSERAVQMLVDQDTTSRQGGAPALRLDLEYGVCPSDGVVLIDDSFVLDREHPVQVRALYSQKCCSGLCRSNGKLFVELGYVGLAQEGIGLIVVGNAGQTQFLRQAPLPGLEASLSPASRLGGIGRNHVNAEFLHSPSHLRQFTTIHRLACLWGKKEVSGTIAVERAKHTVLLDHLPKGGH